MAQLQETFAQQGKTDGSFSDPDEDSNNVSSEDTILRERVGGDEREMGFWGFEKTRLGFWKKKSAPAPPKVQGQCGSALENDIREADSH